MARQPIKNVQQVQQTVQPATQPELDNAQRPVFYSIPSASGAVDPTLRESTNTGDGTTSLVGLLNPPQESANNQLPPTATDLNADQQAPEETPYWKVVEENLAPTMISMIERTVDEEVFEVDLEYTPEMRQEDADEFFREYGTGTPWEANQLGSARSPAHMEMLKGKVLDLRERNARAGERPSAAILGGLFDIDILAGFGGFGIATKAGRAANIATRGIQGAAAGAGIYAYNESTADLDMRTPEERLWDVGTFALTRAFVSAPAVTKSTARLDAAIDAERKAVSPTKEVPPEITYTPVQTGVKTESAPPDLGALKYEPVTEAVETPTVHVDKEPDKPSVFLSVEGGAYLEYYTKTSRKDDVVLPENTYQVVSVGVPKDMQGQGIAKAMYKQAIANAVADNKRFISDNSVSAEALQVYKALEKDGYVFKYNITDDTAKEATEWEGVPTTQYINYDRTPIVELVSTPRQSQKINDVTAGVSGTLPRTALDDLLEGVDLEEAANYVAGSKSTKVQHTTLRTSGSGLDSTMSLEQGFAFSADTEARITGTLARIQLMRDEFRKRHPELYTEQAIKEKKVYGISGSKARTVADVISRKGEYEVSTHRMEDHVDGNPMYTTEVRDGTMYVTGIVHPDIGTWVGKDPTGKIHDLIDSLETATAKPTTGTGVKTQYQVPSTQSTTVLNPKGYGVLQQQYVFPKKLQDELNTETTKLAKELTTGAIKTSNTGGYTRTELLKNNLTANRAASTADELAYYIGDDPTHPAYHLLASVTTEGDNVATAQSAMMNTYGALLVNTELALRAAIKEITGSGRGFLGSVNGKYQENALSVFKDFQKGMQMLDSKIVAFEGKHARLPNDKELGTMLDSLKITPEARTDVALKKVMQTYMKSGFAERIYDDAKLLGTFGEDAEKILRRPSYMPVKHNYDAMKKLVDDGKATWEEVEAFIGSQIVRMYPKLLDPKYAKAGRSFAEVIKGAETAITNPFKLSVRQVGQHFIATQRGNAHNLGDVTSVGMNKTTMHTMLTKAGLSADDADVVVARVFEDQQEVGKSVYKHGRRRIAWDWEDFLDTKSGHRITMADIVDNSAMSNLDAYSRGMAHRNGLARYNIKSEAELDTILESIYDKAPKGVDTKELQTFLSSVKDDLLGNGAGSEVPKSIRAAQAIADMFLLAGSGLLSLVDLTTQLVRTGVINNFANIHYGLRAALLPMHKFTKDEATDLADIMTGRLMQGSRWKWFPTYYTDNYQITGGVYEAAQYYGQSARFMNLSESVKRFQIGILANMYISATKKAAAGSASDIAFLSKKLNMTDELIKKVTDEWNTHGNKIDNWNGDVRIAYEQKIMHEADNLALAIQKGETPAILEYSSVGKVIFPYMRYAFAAQQKILRRTYNRDGSVGLALLMAAQIPVSMMVAMAQNIRNGKEPDEDLVLGTVRAMSALGVLNYPIELIMAGLGQNSVTALAPFSKSYNLIGQFFNSSGRLQDGDYEIEFADEVDWHQVLKNSPLNAATPLHYLYLGLNPED